MNRLIALIAAFAFAGIVFVAVPLRAAAPESVEFEMMTWPEVKAALAAGKTTALFYTGGTEQRGPQNVNGGHTLMGRATVKAIALKLGNAIAMPVLPYTPNNASADLPGTIGLTPDLFGALLERMADQAIVTGFKNVVLMGDHGGGQPTVYQSVAKKLNDKYSAQGIHVFFCDEVYAKANAAYDKYITEKGYPLSTHAGLPDTSEMMYLEDGTWVRKDLIATALGDPVSPPPDYKGAPAKNGITGDGRKSSRDLGKVLFDMRVDHAVRQIQTFIPKS